MPQTPVYFPGLNGLRAIAALTVLFGHVFQRDFADWGEVPGHVPMYGQGVTLFFVISGFLITYLLLVEKETTATVSVPKFYLRRILRIWPLYYAFIAACVIVMAVLGMKDEIVNGTLWYYIFLGANIPFAVAAGLPLIVHLWSIGVEEQFYLFWPWIVKHSKSILKSAVIICMIWIIARYASYAYSICEFGIGGGKMLIYRLLSVTRFQCMMIGSIGAVLYYRRNPYIMFFTKKYVQILLWALLIGFAFYEKFLPSVVVAEFVAVMSLGLIVGQVSSKGFINLENAFFDFVGKISYGIYVIHPLLLFLLSRLWRSMHITCPVWIQCVLIYIISIATTIFVAHLSYRFFESRILRYKNRFAVVNSRNSFKSTSSELN